MEERLTDKSCSEFTGVLAAKTSVPGGGGAAALTGALGIALCMMTGHFTLGKKKYAAYEDDVNRMLEEGEKLRLELLQMVEEDAKSFTPLAQAYAIPKEDPSKAQKLEEATLLACEAPRKIAHLCCHSIDLLSEMKEKGSVMLMSDVGCGAMLCKAALESAVLNVFVNTKSMTDRGAALTLNKEMDELKQKYIPLAEEIANEVTDMMRGE